MTAADVLAMGLHPLLAQPDMDLVVRNDRGFRAPGDADCVGNMIVMAVRDQDVVCLRLGSGNADG